MKVAIIGAGQSGLACALELEKKGISPVIYEKNSFIGELFPHITALIKITHPPIKDAITYYKNTLGIEIKPLNVVNRLIHNSPDKVMTINGNLGYLLKNTRDPDAVKLQMHSKLTKTEVILNEQADYIQLLKEYDYVVCATGNPDYSDELGCWQEWFQGFARGAVVVGNFDPNTIIMWINRDYCKSGYVYLTPFNDKKASIVQVVSDVNEKEIDHYWELFWYTEKISYPIIEEFKLEHKAGFTYPRQIDRLFFVGNAAGGVDPFLGFGHVNALSMGVAAAKTITEGKSFEDQIMPLIGRNVQLRQFRKVFNKMGNKALDDLIWGIGIPGISQAIYKTPINMVKLGANLSKLIVKK